MLLNSGRSGGENDGYETLSETVLTSAAQTITLTGLDLDSDFMYRILIAGDCGHASGGSNVSIYMNSDTTATNYWRHNGTANGNDAIGFVCDPSELAAEILIWKVSGQEPRIITNANVYAISNQLQPPHQHSVAWTSTTNVTQIILSSSIANTFASGVKVIVQKVITT